MAAGLCSFLPSRFMKILFVICFMATTGCATLTSFNLLSTQEEIELGKKLSVEIEKTEISAEIRINDPAQMKAFLDEETKLMKGMVDKIKTAKANNISC